MKVREIMTSGVVTIAPDDTLQAAARKMRDACVGALAVCDGDQPIGILTDRDLVVRSTAEGEDPRRGRVRSAMTPQVIACSDGDELDAAVARMRGHAVRRMVVVDAADRLVGLLSVDDVASRSAALAGEVIEHAGMPDRPDAPRLWPWRE